MKRTFLVPLLAAAAGLMLTGCATGPEPMASQSPSASPTTTVTTSPDQMPEATNTTGTDGAMGLLPDDNETANAGVTTTADAHRAVEAIEDELENLSEVDNAQVVLIGDTAAVALEFDSQYQGGIDDRMREIVQDRVDGVISGVTVVEITDDAGIMDELEKLGDRLENATDMTDIRTELNAIIERITGKSAA